MLNGTSRLDVRLTIQTDDNALIYVEYSGIAKYSKEDADRLGKGETQLLPQRVWIDARNFPPVQLIGINRIGDDPLIGQDPKATQQGWPRIWGEPRDIDFNFETIASLPGFGMAPEGHLRSHPKVSRVAVLWDPADVPPMKVHSLPRCGTIAGEFPLLLASG
jgi:Protein of unknown function (DUF3237)